MYSLPMNWNHGQIDVNQPISAVQIDFDEELNVCERSVLGTLGINSLTVTVPLIWEWSLLVACVCQEMSFRKYS
jgi:hypothetical protein